MNNNWVRWTLAVKYPEPRHPWWEAAAEALVWLALIVGVMTLPYWPVSWKP